LISTLRFVPLLSGVTVRLLLSLLPLTSEL
jgi:hypothetical protein